MSLFKNLHLLLLTVIKLLLNIINIIKGIILYNMFTMSKNDKAVNISMEILMVLIIYRVIGN